MRYLTCSNVFGCSLVASILLMLPATPLLALKPPGTAVQQPASPSSERSKVTTKKPLPADVQRSEPASSSSSERVQADSAVSFPVDI